MTISIICCVNTARSLGAGFADRAGLGWHVQHAVADRRAFCALPGADGVLYGKLAAHSGGVLAH